MQRILYIAIMLSVVWVLPSKAQVSGDLRDIVKDLYGGDGIFLDQASNIVHQAHFTAQTQSGFGSLNDGISSGVGFLSFNSSQTAFVLDLETGVPMRVTDSLGPLIAQTPQTLGEGKFTAGFSFTHIRFTHFEGKKLKDQTLIFNHPPVAGDPDLTMDQVIVDIDIELEQDILALFLNYGVNESTDIGIILPIVHVKATANAVGRVFDPTPAIDPNTHTFNPGSGPLADSPNSSTGGYETGIGDLVLRVKHDLTHEAIEPPFEMGIAGQVVLPTGDHRNLLGTGETRLLAVFLASKTFDKVTPHVNLGYELVPNDHELNAIHYILGLDVAVVPEWTVAFDIIGRWQHSGDDVGDHAVDVAVGTKISIADNILFIANFHVPVNRDEGLRAQFIYTLGIEISF